MSKKAEETPGYGNATALSQLFDCSPMYISQLKKEGVIQLTKTPAGLRYNILESTRSYIRLLRDQAKRKVDRPESEVKKGDAEARLKEAKAKFAELELDELAGSLHRAEDVEAMTTDLVYAVRGTMMALPGRLAVDVVHCATAAEAAAVIRAEVNKALELLADYKYNPAKYKARVRERQNWKRESGYEEDAE